MGHLAAMFWADSTIPCVAKDPCNKQEAAWETAAKQQSSTVECTYHDVLRIRNNKCSRNMVPHCWNRRTASFDCVKREACFFISKLLVQWHSRSLHQIVPWNRSYVKHTKWEHQWRSAPLWTTNRCSDEWQAMKNGDNYWGRLRIQSQRIKRLSNSENVKYNACDIGN